MSPVATYCVGVPGRPPRMFITTDLADAQAQARADEVCFRQANYIPPPHRVSAGGDAVEPMSLPLDVLKAAKWAEVKQRRDEAEWAGCDTPLGRVDTDPDSQRKVSGSVTMAMIAQGAGAPFAVEWTMHDNSVVTHDAPAMIAMGVAVGTHVATVHGIGLTKRAAIDAATDADAVAAVDLEAGWPDA